MLILTKSDLEKVLYMEDLIEVVETAFSELARAAIISPRATITKEAGWMGVVPAYLEKMGSLSTKIVTVFEKDLEKKLPTIMATVILNSTETGAPLAIMDGTFITAMRTGAVCGLATKHLAREDSKTVGVFGAGAQARTQLMAVCTVRNVEKTFVYDKFEERANVFATEMSENLNIPIETGKPEDIVKGSDIIVTATTAKTARARLWLQDKGLLLDVSLL